MWFLNRRVLFVNQWLIDNRRKANWHFCIFCLILCQFRCSVGIRKFRESVSASWMAVKIQLHVQWRLMGEGGDRGQKMERAFTANKNASKVCGNGKTVKSRQLIIKWVGASCLELMGPKDWLNRQESNAINWSSWNIPIAISPLWSRFELAEKLAL